MRSTRPYLAFAVSLTAVAALVGCAGAGGGTQVTSYVTHTVPNPDAADSTDQVSAGGTEPVAPAVDEVTEVYSGVLDNPGQYSFTTGADYPLNGEYRYALVEMTGSGSPELLLQAMSSDHINPIRVFSATDDGTLVSPEDTLVSGAAGAGGYRAGVRAAPEGDRLFQAEWHSLRPEISVRGFVLQGDGLAPNGEVWEDDQRSPSGDLVDIIFHQLNDRGPLEAMQATTTNGGTNTSSGAGSNVGALEPVPAPDSGNTVTGTVRVFTAPELAQFQGVSQTPNGEDATHRFAVFVFDSPTMFTAKSSGNAGAIQERETSMARLGSQTPYSSDPTGFDLEGQHMTLSFDPNSCWFPSDASMPLGQPGCSDFNRQ